MALTTGFRLGPYEILSLIGRGGMGEVYRARDTRLQRDVALKILPESFASNSDRLARLQREAQVLASLNHPNIGSIYGFEESDGVQALVLELVEGSTLADRIALGPILLDEALVIAHLIAKGVDAAHEKGIIHRDLKPANIKITPKRGVKVLDFGLAKLTPLSDADDVTIRIDVTCEGVVMGTPAYMSPEQARGEAIDKRTDVWAFGCLLYEMLTGRAAFLGESVSDTIAAVLEHEPDWHVLPVHTAAGIRRLLRRCLQKDRDRRFRDIGDVRIEIEEAQNEPRAEGDAIPAAPRLGGRLAWMTVAGVLAVALALSIVRTLRPTAPAPEMRVEVTTPATLNPLHFALSPDGGRLVFVASGDGPPRLWVRALDGVAAQPLAGTENAEYPFWSPDTHSIGFFAGGQLKRIDIAGGPPQALADAPVGRGGTWNPDGTILFAASNAGPLWLVPAKGGAPAAVTRIGPGQSGHRLPQFLPDGRRFLFYVTGGGSTHGIYLGSLDGKEPRQLVASDAAGAWAPPDRLLFVRQGALMAALFDAEREAIGEPVTVADPVGFDTAFNLGGFSVSAAGLVAYRAHGSERRQLTWFERDGRRVGPAGEPDSSNLNYPELSPDGRRVVVARTVQSDTDIWLIDLVRGGATRVTFDAALDTAPLWSPDGTQIVFRSNRKGAYDLYLKPSSGGGREALLQESTGSKVPLSWSSDGRFLLFYEVDPKTNFDLWTLSLRGDGKPSPWLNTPFVEAGGQFSPDGRWVAYQSNESGQFEIYVQPFPAASAKWQISTQGGTMPRWRTDGKELFFIAPDAKLMTAAVRASNTTFEVASPVVLFETRMVGGPGQVLKHQYAVSRDGRFLINELAEESTATPITLILNWKPRL